MIRILVVLTFAIFATSCRNLTSDEKTALHAALGPEVELSNVLIIPPASKSDRATVQERLQRQMKLERAMGITDNRYTDRQIRSFASNLTSRKAYAVAVGTKIFYLNPSFYKDNMAANWPKERNLNDLSNLLHEYFHIWQYTNRKRTGYSLSGIVAEHIKYGADVYRYNLKTHDNLLDFRFEQQAKIAEDYFLACFDVVVRPGCSRLRKMMNTVFDIPVLEKQLHDFKNKNGV